MHRLIAQQTFSWVAQDKFSFLWKGTMVIGYYSMDMNKYLILYHNFTKEEEEQELNEIDAWLTEEIKVIVNEEVKEF